ncbi:MAG: glutamate-5-semialdehyde dehydrogenase, partial [Anaerolineales bacterium]|nr:glutamate-5-semialdehyde dehydrogenase [Anaerolineales bacterium]
VLAANAEDVDAARAAGREPWLVDRLTLTPARLDAIVADVRGLALLADPVGETFDATTLDNGLKLHRQRVPLGVLGVIYEARPNVTVDVAALAIKTGNVAILRGGSETLRSNQALMGVVTAALSATGLPETAVQLIEDTDRQRIFELLQMHDVVDVIIPRGGVALHKLCREHARMPVIVGGVGVCHLFVDVTADLERSLPVIANAKTQRPSVCNTLDTVLVHASVAATVLPRIVSALAPLGVSFRAAPRALDLVAGVAGATVLPAGPDDFDTEWMSLVLGLKVVDSLEEAMDHIAAHSQNHSDGILTEDVGNATRFLNEVDSAAVFWNASTRFNDGGQMGLGAEVAVSTQRLHVRGPMGLRELTTYKWVGTGDYHVRS